jgi:hypothetical protein
MEVKFNSVKMYVYEGDSRKEEESKESLLCMVSHAFINIPYYYYYYYYILVVVVVVVVVVVRVKGKFVLVHTIWRAEV